MKSSQGVVAHPPDLEKYKSEDTKIQLNSVYTRFQEQVSSPSQNSSAF
jgi:hypothetical protein